MGQIIILMGPTGAGKSIQAEFLAAHGWYHISSGELLRHVPADSVYLASGQLAPSTEVERLVEEAIRAVEIPQPIVLDGFPRTIDEAEWLDTHVTSWGRELTGVILLDVSEATALARLQGRRRSDDNAAAVAQKRIAFDHETRPLVEYYQTKRLLHLLDGEQNVDAVGAELLGILAS